MSSVVVLVNLDYFLARLDACTSDTTSNTAINATDFSTKYYYLLLMHGKQNRQD